MIYKIYRVRRKGKRVPEELMHNHIEARSTADALRVYHLTAPTVDLRDVEARAA